jgi:hypothetical protein
LTGSDNTEAEQKRVVDVLVEVPIQTEDGRLIETARQSMKATVPRRKERKFVGVPLVLTYAGRKYALSDLVLPCDEDYSTWHDKQPPVRVRPRQYNDVVRDESGNVVGSRIY